jgi:hypothetical protein
MSFKTNWAIPAFVAFLLFSVSVKASGEENDTVTTQNQKYKPEDSPSFEDNEYCLRCHASGYFILSDSASGQSRRQAMCDNFNISREKYYNSVHRTFSCTDCHSFEYKTFPHASALRFEPKLVCIDCHGGDETFAKYHFEEIEVEYSKSIHANAENGEFSCWKCHNPHSYVPLARRDTLTTNFVVASNQMCLSCHGNLKKFQLLSDRELTGVIDKHDWLPNHELHFKSVRCIECHSAQNANILISHNIMHKDSAVSDCVKCHSGNSLLMGTLYKFRTIQSRKSYGFVNGVIINNDSYVIGANHSRFMNYSGIIIIILTLIAVSIHIIFRIKKSKKVNQ